MADFPEYYYAIKDALENGYRVDLLKGEIIGLKGKPLTIAVHGKQRYPTVPLVTPNMPRRFYSVPAHKVVAFAIWGDAAFQPGVHVRHSKGVLDISQGNLILGTLSENELDKDDAVRSRSASIARLSQGKRPLNRVLTEEQVLQIRANCRIGPTGRAVRGEVTRFANLLGVSKSTVSMALRGNTWTDLR